MSHVVSSFGRQIINSHIARLVHMHEQCITLQSELTNFIKILRQHGGDLTQDHANSLVGLQLMGFDVQKPDDNFDIMRGNAMLIIPVLETLMSLRPDLISPGHIIRFIDAVAFESHSCLEGCNLKPLLIKMALQPGVVFSSDVLSRMDKLQGNQPKVHGPWIKDLYSALEKRDCRSLADLPRLTARRVKLSS